MRRPVWLPAVFLLAACVPVPGASDVPASRGGIKVSYKIVEDGRGSDAARCRLENCARGEVCWVPLSCVAPEISPGGENRPPDCLEGFHPCGDACIPERSACVLPDSPDPEREAAEWLPGHDSKFDLLCGKKSKYCRGVCIPKKEICYPWPLPGPEMDNAGIGGQLR